MACGLLVMRARVREQPHAAGMHYWGMPAPCVRGQPQRHVARIAYGNAEWLATVFAAPL